MTNLLLQIAGLAKQYFSKISSGSQAKIKVLIYVLVIASAFSAFMLTNTIYAVIPNSSPRIICWSMLFLVIFQLERLVLTADPDQKATMIGRAIMATVIACITSLSVEFNFFENTAVNEQIKTRQAQQLNIAQDYMNNKTSLLSKKRELQNTINSNSSLITSKSSDLQKEVINGNGVRAAGWGVVAKDLYEVYKIDSANLEKQNAQLLSQIQELNQQITSDSINLVADTFKLNLLNLNDPVEKLNQIHSVVFKSKGSTWLYILIHLFCMIFELFVLIGKLSYSSAFTEYELRRKSDEARCNQTELLEDRAKELELLSFYEKKQLNIKVENLRDQAKSKLSLAKDQINFLDEYSKIVEEAESIIRSKIDKDEQEQVKKVYSDSSIEDILNSSKLFTLK